MQKIVLIGLLIFCGSAFSQTSFKGSSRLRIEMPKVETQIVTAARHVLDTHQELIASCPANSKIVSATCTGNTRTLYDYNLTLAVENEDLIRDMSFLNYPTKTLVEAAQAKCTAEFVKPKEVVTLIMSLQCQPNQNGDRDNQARR